MIRSGPKAPGHRAGAQGLPFMPGLLGSWPEGKSPIPSTYTLPRGISRTLYDLVLPRGRVLLPMKPQGVNVENPVADSGFTPEITDRLKSLLGKFSFSSDHRTEGRPERSFFTVENWTLGEQGGLVPKAFQAIANTLTFWWKIGSCSLCCFVFPPS